MTYYLSDSLRTSEPLSVSHQSIFGALVAYQAVRDAVHLDGFQIEREDGEGPHIQNDLQPVINKR